MAAVATIAGPRPGGGTVSRTICDGLQVIEMGAGSIGASFAGMMLADNGPGS